MRRRGPERLQTTRRSKYDEKTCSGQLRASVRRSAGWDAEGRVERFFNFENRSRIEGGVRTGAHGFVWTNP